MARKRRITPLEEFSAAADSMGMQYGKYSQYLYREECRQRREKEMKKRAKNRKTN